MPRLSFPKFDLSLKNTVVLSFLIVVIFSCAVFFYPLDLSFKQEERTEPLVKTASLQLTPGEKYAYAYTFANNSFTTQYDVIRTIGGCTLVSSTSSNISARVEACIKPDGTLYYAKVVGEGKEFNLTALDFFQEWMLALNENWAWSREIIQKNEQLAMNQSTKFDFKVTGVKEFKGRKAFTVQVTTSSIINGEKQSGSTQEWVVDYEKRILLSSQIYGGNIELVEAPFALR